jgi:hypothetical protein
VLYECLTGERPFRGVTLVDMADKVLHADPAPPSRLRPEVTPQVEAVCLRAMARQREDRFQTGSELADALRALVRGSDESHPEPAPRSSSPGWPLILAGVLLIAVASGLGAWLALPDARVESAAGAEPPAQPEQTDASTGGDAAPVAPPAPVEPHEPEAWDWVLVYYMSYDNPLDYSAGRQILDMLAAGLATEGPGRVEVVCLADFLGPGGLQRFTLSSEEPEFVEGFPDEEGSSEEETLAGYLEWVLHEHPARRYGLVFLDNAGRLDQMSSDDTPRPGGQSYLHIPEVAELIRGFRERAEGEVELVFLQQPSRSNVETHYHFRRSTRYVMATQVGLAAPNRYYPETLAFLRRNPDADGLQLATQIALNEADDQFVAYTALSAAALQELPERLALVLAPALQLERVAAPRAGYIGRGPEGSADWVIWLQSLYQDNGLPRRPLDRFLDWVRGELIAVHRVSPGSVGSEYDVLCGVSVYTPSAPRELVPYEDFAIYRDTDLDLLLRRFWEQR